MYDVVAMGEALVDFVCIEGEKKDFPLLQAHPGGAPANFLSALSAYGGKTAFIGKVGRDVFGELLVKALQDCGVDMKGAVWDEERFTTMAFVTLDQDGERRFSFARKPGADTGIRIEEVDTSLLDKTRVFHFGSLSLTDEPARETTAYLVKYAKERGCILSYDPNLRLSLWKNVEEAKKQLLWGMEKADMVKISEEVRFLFQCEVKEGIQKLIQNYGIQLVFVTCGAGGCFYANERAEGFLPSLQGITVQDTTGAGDIFYGSALSRMLRLEKLPRQLSAEELEEIVSFATVAAGLSVTRGGGISSIFREDQIEDHREEYKAAQRSAV